MRVNSSKEDFNPTILTPHRNKLYTLKNNVKLPASDVTPVKAAIKEYEKWVTNRSNTRDISQLTDYLNDYKRFIDINLIFDSEHEFLYRYKREHKVDNTIFEEFLIDLLLPLANKYSDMKIGSLPTLSNLSFSFEGKLRIINKDQDVAIVKEVHLNQKTLNIPIVVIECKTKLDKGMLTECLSDAKAIKSLCPFSSYFVVSEWLNMDLPNIISPIDGLFLFRKSKRVPKSIQEKLWNVTTRTQIRKDYLAFYDSHSINANVVDILYNEIEKALTQPTDIPNLLTHGYYFQ